MWRAAAIVLVVLAACSSSGKGPVAGSASTGSASKASGLTQCAEVLIDGAPFTADRFHSGCLDGNKPNLFVAINCNDGRKLMQQGKVWAFVDDKVHVVNGSVAADPAYSAAYAACTA